MIPLTKHLSSGCLTCIISIYEDIISIWVELMGHSDILLVKNPNKNHVLCLINIHKLSLFYGIWINNP